MNVLINRLLVWVVGFILLACFWLVIFFPDWLYILAPFSLLATLFFILHLVNYQIKKSQFWVFIITPVIFIFSSWLFLIFIESLKLSLLYSLVFAWVIFIFIKAIFLYLYRRPKYQPHALENISGYLNLLAVFLLAAGLYNFKFFIGFDAWYVLVLVPLAVWLLLLQLFNLSNIAFKKSWLISAIITLVIAQVVWATNYLPTSAYVDGLIVALVYYLLAGIARNWLLDIRERRVVVRYLLICIISLLIILLSAKWI